MNDNTKVKNNAVSQYLLEITKYRGPILCAICKPELTLANKVIFGGIAPIKIVCEPCFVDYRSTAIGIL